ncbi:hypothetical protein [Corynebacterium meridianum]|uniref:Uncharacterized protein n=1 Tax=Corynebacterium meridianum TaxID=2765363 RepID=A0A934I5J6_9CORY|nr:hypothetical protein [Corynebacterium meridianum]MBI8988757.1 hypothetical protein [Corynebacterium meridianum]MCK7677228.1 hypothetical protein [Corynebacterium meridianum]
MWDRFAEESRFSEPGTSVTDGTCITASYWYRPSLSLALDTQLKHDVPNPAVGVRTSY